MVIFNAATSIITTKSPYIARTSMTLPQISAPLGTWAAKNGIKKVVTLVADYGPGNDAEAAFKKTFTAGGGQGAVESIRTPLQNPDFGPVHPARQGCEAGRSVHFRARPAQQSIAVMKAYNERGLAQAGIKAIATGDVTDDACAERDGRRRARADHDVPLFGGPRLARRTRRSSRLMRRSRRTRAAPTS